jgi:hypothetical protein
VVFERRLPNDLAVIRRALLGNRPAIRGLAVGSTCNWYR